jgi:predicted ATPase
MRKFIITGGPNSGKSSLIDLLSKRGYCVLTESSRVIIEEMHIFPWDNQAVFCEVFRNVQIKRESELTGDTISLDRSLVDPIAYAEVAGVEINKAIHKDIEDAKYERRVFFLEMLPNYITDDQRKDTPEQAAAVQKKLREVYQRLGFTLVDVPLFSSDKEESLKSRLELILRVIAE